MLAYRPPHTHTHKDIRIRVIVIIGVIVDVLIRAYGLIVLFTAGFSVRHRVGRGKAEKTTI